ncbi:MAG: RnfH family protein [Thiothrix nivea]|nr:MAG: RnfH family protein [Thiothrix nivea]
MVEIEVIYPLPNEQVLFKTRVAEGATIRDGIEASGVLEHYPELDPDKLKVGIFGKMAPMKTVLRAKDRIEIYRPLIADPKEVRKQRAAAGKRMKKGGGDV